MEIPTNSEGAYIIRLPTEVLGRIFEYLIPAHNIEDRLSRREEPGDKMTDDDTESFFLRGEQLQESRAGQLASVCQVFYHVSTRLIYRSVTATAPV
jgi:hypothetical protein